MTAYRKRGVAVPITPEERKQILELYNNGQGSTFTEIGEKLNRNRYTVYKICKDWQPPKKVQEYEGEIFQYTEKHFESLFINFSA
jgi:DNA invertase Pin-like site-specific DNA recombinase